MMPSEVAVPYEAKGTPIVEFVEHNGAKFKTVCWKVPQSVKYKGKIIFVHGFSEQSGIYTEFFDNLSQNGYEVFFFDQRGAGETSPGKLVGQTNEFYTFDDLDFFIARNYKELKNANEKFFLMGHSMGGGIILNYGIRGKHKDKIKGIVACGPLIFLHNKSMPNIVSRLLLPYAAKVYPGFTLDSKLNYDFITTNERWKNYIIEHDKKLIGSFGQFNDMFKRGKDLLNREYVGKFDKNISLLILHGTHDYINDIKGSEEFFELLPDDRNKSFDKVDAGRHSLFIENDKVYKLVFDKVLAFCDAL
ncbi:hypothetical protein KGF56_004258 [Candida oxycetoniae]|uniref:Serine aminopeptidase S33 domain-containing protein n=1 Tax=Candida oxycetoniae TaxID=497107 RepID=A0AAI9STZ0_9ASCO|nr:uncharacterized protein KGF56_004258 [Candida oxycetoniae]KAI3403005.2 hypothetical protein KGF56_004258 [Candida oxycetoniae]